eukprot:gene25583-11236_t
MTGRAAREAAVRHPPLPPAVSTPPGPNSEAQPPPGVSVPASVPAPAPAPVNSMRPPIAAATAAPPKNPTPPQASIIKPSTSGDVRADSPLLPPPALQRSHSLGAVSCDGNSSGPPKSGREGANAAGATASTRLEKQDGRQEVRGETWRWSGQQREIGGGRECSEWAAVAPCNSDRSISRQQRAAVVARASEASSQLRRSPFAAVTGAAAAAAGWPVPNASTASQPVHDASMASQPVHGASLSLMPPWPASLSMVPDCP